MPVYGGPFMTGLLLWKGTRINMGETGPMFGGENGGHGLFTDTEQQALIDYHKVIPAPLNPFLDPVTGGLTAEAAIGRDLFFGSNLTGMNENNRSAGCATCHTDTDEFTLQPRGYTTDFLDPSITDTLDFGFVLEEFCNPLKENISAANLRNINSGVNVDEDNDGFPDDDRNFDGYSDIESYIPMNVDDEDPFQRDDPNSYLCPEDPEEDPNGPIATFDRDKRKFVVPTKLGVFSTGPYMHDNSMIALRHIVDPESQMSDPVYGNANYPTSFKFYNEFHDLRGHEEFAPLVSKVQISLQSPNVQQDIDRILAFIESL
jgi:hypothetical protein